MLKRKHKNPNTLRFPPNIPGPSADPRMRVSLYLPRRSVMAPHAHRCRLALHKTESPDENRGTGPGSAVCPTQRPPVSRHGPDAASQSCGARRLPRKHRSGSDMGCSPHLGSQALLSPPSLGPSAPCHRGHPYSPASL